MEFFATQAMHGNEESVAVQVFESKEFSAGDPEVELDQSAVDADSMLGVNEVAALLELREAFDARAFGPMRPHPAALARAEDLLFGQNDQAFRGEDESLRKIAYANFDASGRRPARCGPEVLRDSDFEAVLAQQMAQPFCTRKRGNAERRPPTCVAPLRERFDERFEGAIAAARLDQFAAEGVVAAAPKREVLAFGLDVDHVESLQKNRLAREHLALEFLGRKRQFVRSRDDPAAFSRDLVIFLRVRRVSPHAIAAGFRVVDDD
jgi:hypothetical protein